MPPVFSYKLKYSMSFLNSILLVAFILHNLVHINEANVFYENELEKTRFSVKEVNVDNGRLINSDLNNSSNQIKVSRRMSNDLKMSLSEINVLDLANNAYSKLNVLFDNSVNNIWLLAGHKNERARNGMSYDVYLSSEKNHFKLFNTELESKLKLSGKVQIENIFTFKDQNIIILTDLSNKQLFVSINDGASFDPVDVKFRPDIVYMNNKQKTLFAVEENESTKNVWLSSDFGKTWSLLCENAVSLPNWVESRFGLDQSHYIYFVNAEKSLVQVDLRQIESKDSANILMPNVQDYKIFEDYKFITCSIDGNLNLRILNNKLSSKEFKINNELVRSANILKYEIIEANSNEILLALVYKLDGQVKADLYSSKRSSLFEFNLALRNIFVNTEKEQSKVEIKLLTKYGNVYLANVKEDDKSPIKTLVKNSYDDKWTELETDAQTEKFHVDLGKKLIFSHEIQNSDDPQLPEFAMASMVDMESANSKVFALKSYSSEVTEWSEILDGDYFYSFSNYGDLIIAVDKDKPTNRLIYSDNIGSGWSTLQLSTQQDQLYFVNSLIKKEAGESKNIFLIFATDSTTGVRKVFKLVVSKSCLIQKAVSEEQVELNADISQEVVVSQGECGKRCVSKMNQNVEICFDESIKCNMIVDCMDGSDEEKCAVEQKFSNHQLDNFIKSVYDLSFSKFEYKDSKLELSYKIDTNPLLSHSTLNDRVKINSFKIKIIELVYDSDNKIDSDISLNQLESDEKLKRYELTTEKYNGDFEFMNANENSDYICFVYANLTLENEDGSGSFNLFRLNMISSYSIEDESNQKSKSFLNTFLTNLFGLRKPNFVIKLTILVLIGLIIFLALVYLALQVFYLAKNQKIVAVTKNTIIKTKVFLKNGQKEDKQSLIENENSNIV